MAKLVTYTFKAFDSEYPVVLNPNEHMDQIAEMSAALTEANREFLWKLPAFIRDSNGAWFDCDEPNTYRWVEGNFCD